MSLIGARILPRAKNQQESDLFQSLDQLIKELRVILNGGLNFTDNFDAKILDYVSHGTPDTEKVLAHTLGKVPAGYIVYRQDKAGSLYTSTGGTTWTTTAIYLKCTVATVAFKLIIF
jgi:hypothetical protein